MWSCWAVSGAPRLLGDRAAVGTEDVECVAEVGGGPQHGGVGGQSEAERLVDLVVEVSAPDVALVGEEQITASCVQAFRPCSAVGVPNVSAVWRTIRSLRSQSRAS